MIPLNSNLSGLKRSQIRVFTNLAKQTEDCAMLTIGEPDFDTPQNIKDALVAALNHNQTHYAPNQGTAQLRQAVADYETNRGNPVNPEQVLITVGACQALYTALTGILNPGEEVIVPTPGFVLYESIVTAAGGRVVPLDTAKTGFQITEDALQAAISPRTKAIVINSPCNPSGTIFSRESLEAVKGAILGRDIFLVWDGVYGQLAYGECPDLTLDGELRQQTILCQSFSKPYAMTGWRVGYLVCPEYVMDRLLLLGALTITAIPTFIQAAAVEALKTDTSAMKAVYQKRRDYVCGRLRDMGLSFPEPQGAFYVFPSIEPYGMDSQEFCTRMIREGRVAAVPGVCFGAEGYIRLSYCYSDEELKKGLDRMEAFLEKLKSQG